MHSEDTIAAIATPPGQAGIGIVRLSGALVPQLTHALLGRTLRPRRAAYCRFRDASGELIDEGIALYFAAPASFTGEHVLELQGHGGPVVLELLLARVLELGARLAQPGEFSLRAFLNDKLDLAQAEAIADLIAAGSAQAARAAMRSLQGEFSERVRELVEAVSALRVHVEATMDFPDEEIDFLSDGAIARQLGQIGARLDALQSSARQGRLLRDGISLVILGPPNAGKSSLLNRLAGHDAAIVAELPGTTRDVLREHIHIDGLPLHVVDTAGLRDGGDPVEQEGMRRARSEAERADRLLLVLDDQQHTSATEHARMLPRSDAWPPATIVHNKIDLSGHAPGAEQRGDTAHVFVSALTGAGIADLREHLKTCMGFVPDAGGDLIARRRHQDAIRRARTHFEHAQRQLEDYHAGELVAEELRLMQQALGEITGEVTSDDLLGRIFASFCIGK